jgi:hypothetical protein
VIPVEDRAEVTAGTTRIPRVAGSRTVSSRSAGFEEAYWQAKEALYRRGKRIGKTLEDTCGVRLCVIDGIQLTDRELLIEAWGSSLADEIIADDAAATGARYAPATQRRRRQPLPAACA